jgi:hypothetical protein
MSFKVLTSTPSAAVASGGTLTFTLGNAAEWGQVKLEGGHFMFAEGLQAGFNFPVDFSMSVSGATITVTYNGTTPLPAGKNVVLQLETPGENNYLFDGRGVLPEVGKDNLGNIRWCTAKPVRVLIGNPAVASATAIVNAAARASALTTTYATVYVNDIPRALTVKSSNAGDTTQTITLRGTDEYGVAVTETLTLNGTSAVNGKKAFKTVISDTTSASLAGNLSVGTQNVFGLPCFLPGGTSAGIGYALKEVQDGAVATAGTWVGGDLTKATATTGDIRGTWVPNATPDGSKVFELVVMFTDVTFKGVPQYGL